MCPMHRGECCARVSRRFFDCEIEPRWCGELRQQGVTFNCVAACGAQDEIAVIVDRESLAVLARQPLEIGRCRGCEAAVLPDVERVHEMAGKALDDMFGTDFGEAFLVERRYVWRGAGIRRLAPCSADGRG